MPATRQDLFARLDELGIATRTLEHEAVFTVAESSKLERELPGGHTKNLFLKDKKGRLFLVVALGHAVLTRRTPLYDTDRASERWGVVPLNDR